MAIEILCIFYAWKKIQLEKLGRILIKLRIEINYLY